MQPVKQSLLDRLPSAPQLGGLYSILLLGTLIFSFLVFSYPLALGLVLLGGLAFRLPVHGLGVLILIVSIDFVSSFQGIYLSISEFELVVCWLALAANAKLKAGQTGPDFKSLIWASPFLIAVFLSGAVNLELYKVGPHLIRQSEMFLAFALAAGMRFETKDATIRWYWTLAAAGHLIVRVVTSIWSLEESSLTMNFSNINQFAGFISLFIPFALVVTLDRGAPRALRLMSCCTFIASYSSLVFLATRAALLASLGALIAFRAALGRLLPGDWGWIFRARRGWVGLGSLLLALFLLLVPQNQSLQTRLLTTLNRYSIEGIQKTAERRLSIYRMGLVMLKDHLFFGVGPGRYDDAYDDYAYIIETPIRERFSAEWDSQVRNPAKKEAWLQQVLKDFRYAPRIHLHNLALQLAVSFGLGGLVGFLVWLSCVFREFVRHRRQFYGAAGLAVIWIFFAQNLFDVTFPSLGIETGLMLGIAMGLSRAGGSLPVEKSPSI